MRGQIKNRDLSDMFCRFLDVTMHKVGHLKGLFMIKMYSIDDYILCSSVESVLMALICNIVKLL